MPETRRELRAREHGPTLLRLMLGPLFFIAGLFKLVNLADAAWVLRGLGLPAPTFFAIAIVFVEIVFGLAVFAGFKVRYTVWPLIIILLGAIIAVHVPALGRDLGAPTQIMFRLLGVASLLSLFLTGPGALALELSPERAEERRRYRELRRSQW